MSAPRRGWDPGSGSFGRLTSVAYRLAMIELALLIATAPTIAGTLLLARDASNIPLYALCALPLGPALSAAVYAVRRSPGPEGAGELEPFRRFWRGWISGLRQSLAVWAPTCVLAAFAGFNLAFGAESDAVLVAIGAGVAVAVLIWAVGALVVVAGFRFRLGDLVRVTLYGLGARPLVPLGILSLLVLAAAVVAFGSDWVLALLGWLFVLALWSTTRPMVRVITERFTEEGH